MLETCFLSLRALNYTSSVQESVKVYAYYAVFQKAIDRPPNCASKLPGGPEGQILAGLLGSLWKWRVMGIATIGNLYKTRVLSFPQRQRLPVLVQNYFSEE